MLRRNFCLCLSAGALPLVLREARAQAPGSGNAASAFDGLGKKIEAEYADVESVVVVRRGQVLFEHDRGDADALRDVQSVTKSTLALAVGAALGRGAIRSLDQPVTELLGVSDASDVGRNAAGVTVRHLLTMTSGYAPQARFTPGTADALALLMQRQRVAPPGAVFAYDNASANLLSLVLEAATGQATASFAEQAIFRPLGITAYEWARGANGHTLGFVGLRLRTRDMARLGQLVLAGGQRAGTQLIPASYAREATTAQNRGGAPVGLAYGYLWWVVPSTAERPTVLASGLGGQFIWVHPALELVIATTSAVSVDANRRGQALKLILNELFRAASGTPP